MSNLKKSFSARAVLVLILLFSLSAFAPMSQAEPGVPVLDNILKIALAFATLVGVSALVTALVAIARRFNLIKTDEQAGKITAALNLLAFIILVLIGVFRPDLSLSFLDSVAARLAAIALFVLGFLVQMTTPAPIMRAFYRARVPLLGSMGDAETLVPAHYVNYTNPKQD